MEPPEHGGATTSSEDAAEPALQRTLRASVLEGGVSEIWAALATGAVLTAWGLHLGADAFAIASLQAIATGAQVLHGPAGFVTAWLGRRRVAIVALALARLVWLPLALSPWIGLEGAAALALLFVVVTLSAVLQVAGTNAWTVWMGDVVPTRIRGRFFGARNAFATGGSAAAALAAAIVLDAGASFRGYALPVLALLLAASGAWSARLLLRQVEGRSAADRAPSVSAYLDVLRDRNAWPMLGYQLWWGIAIAPGAAFFSLHVLDRLGGTFAMLAAHAVVMAIVRVLTVPLWGRAVDAYGPRPVLVVCSATIALTPLLWITCGPGFLWPLALDAVVAGFLWGGHAIASFDLPLEVAPQRERSYYLALFSMALGLGFMASSFASGGLASELPDEGWLGLSDLEWIFVVSSLGRLSSALVAARIPSARSTKTRTMLRSALRPPPGVR